MDRLTHANATHLLRCKHAIGTSVKHYYMRCHILKYMDDKVRAKVLVFGERNWAHRENIKHIRYVPKHKIWDRYNNEI